MSPTAGESLAYRTVDGLTLHGELYRPAGSAPAPYVVEVHGGAWGANDRFSNRLVHDTLVAAGIGVFALDFRLAAQARYPAPVEDVNYAIRWFKQHTAMLGVHASAIGGIGFSSGGQQLGLNVLWPDNPDYAARPTADLGAEDASLAFFVACWPILDPLARYRTVQAAGNERLIAAHHAYFEDEAAMASGNPYQLVCDGKATHLPPMLIVQGTADGNVNHARADDFAQAYRERSGAIEVCKYEDAPHTFFNVDPSSADTRDALARIVAFCKSAGETVPGADDA